MFKKNMISKHLLLVTKLTSVKIESNFIAVFESFGFTSAKFGFYNDEGVLHVINL